MFLWKELLKNNKHCLITNPNDPEKFAKQIIFLFKNKNLMKKFHQI